MATNMDPIQAAAELQAARDKVREAYSALRRAVLADENIKGGDMARFVAKSLIDAEVVLISLIDAEENRDAAKN